MLRTRRHKLVAWTCIFAIWLSVFMPTISRSLGAMGTVQIFNDICTTSGLSHSDSGDSGKSSLPSGDHWNACGYCTLLANSPPVTGSFDILVATAATMSHDSPLLYDYTPPRPFRGQTHPLDPPLTIS